MGIRNNLRLDCPEAVDTQWLDGVAPGSAEPGSLKAAGSHVRGRQESLGGNVCRNREVLGTGVRHAALGRYAKQQNRRKHCAGEEQLASLLLEDS